MTEQKLDSLINQHTFLGWDAWSRVDLNLFRTTFPELRQVEQTSIVAIAKGEPTDQIKHYMTQEDFMRRMSEYVPRLLQQIQSPAQKTLTPTQVGRSKSTT